MATVESIAAANYKLTATAEGRTDYAAIVFLLQILAREQPRTIVEIGVESGTSSLLILKYLESRAPAARLWSFDLATHYNVDHSLPIGYLVHRHYNPIPSTWSLHTRAMSSDVAQILATNGATLPVDVVYIDANHLHPWPTFDILMCLGFCRPGSVIALHDINLPRRKPEFQAWGAAHLFDQWTGEKWASIDQERHLPTIGAIRLSHDLKRDVVNLLAILDLPWETSIDHRLARRLLATADMLDLSHDQVTDLVTRLERSGQR